MVIIGFKFSVARRLEVSELVEPCGSDLALCLSTDYVWSIIAILKTFCDYPSMSLNWDDVSMLWNRLPKHRIEIVASRSNTSVPLNGMLTLS